MTSIVSWLVLWNSHKNVAELRRVMGSQPSPMDNYICNSNIDTVKLWSLELGWLFSSFSGFCRSLLLVFFCRLYCLSFELRILITTLVSTNSSYPSRASELNPSLCRVYGAWSLVFCVVFCRSLFWFVFFPLYCLSFFDLRILITTLVSSNSSCPY